MNVLCRRKGGLDIKWKIENIDFLLDGSNLKSPKFFIGTSNKTEWTLEIVKHEKPSCLILYLNKEDAEVSSDITIESFIKFTNSYISEPKRNINHKIVSYSSFSSFKQIIAQYFLEDINDILVGKTEIICCQLRNISYADSTSHFSTFRTLIEAEYRNERFVIPNIKYCDTLQDMFFPMISINSTSIDFKLILMVNKNKNININICKTTENEETILLLCQLSIENEKNENILSNLHKHEFVREGETVWKFPSCFEYKLFEKYLNEVGDVLYLNCKLLISENKCRTWMEEYKTDSCHINENQKKEIASSEKTNLCEDLMCLYIEQKCPDVEIKVNGKIFPAHKSILSARSPVFSAMFNNHMIEKEKNMVEISDLEAETVDKMLFFMYSEIVRDKNWETMVKLLIAADKYQILTLKDRCCEYLRNKLTAQNVCEALLVSDRLHDVDLKNFVREYIANNSKNVFLSDEWKEFMKSEAKLAGEIMHKAFQ